MPSLYLLNKPFNVLSQFTGKADRSTLAEFINIPNIYPAGRLDYDSEGLLILTNDGEMQARIADPKHKLTKTYWVQLEGNITDRGLEQLEKGVMLKDGLTKPAKARRIAMPNIWERTPPIRYRKNDITSWIELSISEGKNRQVRRMTAEVGFPTLRLIRYKIGPWTLDGIEQGNWSKIEVHLPKKQDIKRQARSKTSNKQNNQQRKPKHRNY